MTDNDINTMSFEAAFERLNTIIQQMERGELTLEDSLALYEQGRQLAARCEHLLDNAELRVSQLDNPPGTLL
jgi:exodeoxyribonuclease VII small subunit